MTFKTKLPIRKSEEDIKFYLKNGPLFGNILLRLYEMIRKGTIVYPEEVIEKFEFACHCAFHKYYYHYPFSTQRNIYEVEFGNSICVSINDEVAHGKSTKRFEDGDIVSVDCGLALSTEPHKGPHSLTPIDLKYLHFDAAFTLQIGQEEEWVKAPHKALQNIKAEQPENVYEVGSVVEDTCNEHELSNIISLTGHGIGYNLHEPPYIHNARGDYLKEEIFEGLCFCAEPIFAKRKNKNKLIERTCIDSDGWTILTQSGVPTSHFETMYCKHEGRIVDLLGVTEWSL